MNKLHTFLKYHPQDQLLFFELGFNLIKARTFVQFASPRQTAMQWGSLGHENTAQLSEMDDQLVATLSHQCAVIARVIPNNAFNCRVMATAAAWMLKRRRIPTTVYVGFRHNNETREIDGHAWLRSGSHIVTGKKVYRYFQMFSYYGSSPY